MFLPEPPKADKRAPPDPLTIREIYIDETSQTKHRYLVLGGVIVNHTYAEWLEQQLWEARHPELPQGELKWTKVSQTKLPAYIKYVDVFFAGLDEHSTLDAHLIVIDMHKVDDRTYNRGSRDIGFNKEIYQLCMKFARLYRSNVFHVYPDRRNTPSSTEELRLTLNSGCRKGGDPRDWPFRRLHFRESASSQCLQLIDILIGAIAFKLNGHYDKPDASPAKRALCDHVMLRAGVQNVARDTAVSGRFTIWHRRLKETSRGPRPSGRRLRAVPLPR